MKEQSITPQINSQTKCPTCGSTVTVGGEGETHYYIPITPESEILKSLEGVRVDKLENVFTPQPTDDVDWDEVFDFYVKESEQVPERSLAVNLFHFLKSKFKITRR